MNFKDIEFQIENEYELEREPTEFIKWALDCFTRVKGKCNNVQFQRSKILKRVREEAWPLRIVLKNNPDAFNTVQLINGSQNYDGIGRRDTDHLFIEITCFKDGQFDLFQAEHIDQFGSAPASGVAKEAYRKATVTQEPAVGECVYSGTEIQRALDGAVECILKKSDKEYFKGTILIVGIDGITSFIDEGSWLNFRDQLLTFDIHNEFEKIFIVCLISERCFQLK